MGERSSLHCLKGDLETYNRAKRQLAAELDEDLSTHEALRILCERYLDE